MSNGLLELGLTRLFAVPAASVAAPLFAAFLQRAKEGVVTQRGSVRINASPASVHALLDPAASANRWRLRGERIEPIDARGGVYRLFSHGMEERPVLVEIAESRAPERITAACRAEDGGLIDALMSSTGVYDIAPLGGGARVTLAETTRFSPDLSRFQFAYHALIMRSSLRADLLRLKFEAETGRDADAWMRSCELGEPHNLAPRVD